MKKPEMNLHFQLDWRPLPDAAASAPAAPGIYFLGAPFRIAYGTTESRTFYVGCSLNLRKRLVGHLAAADRGNYLLLAFADATKGNIGCAFSAVKGIRSENRLMGLEGAVMHAFGVAHGFIPHGNRMPEGADWDGTVMIGEPPCESLPLLNEDEIAARYNLIVDRYPYPIYHSLSAMVVIGATGVQIQEMQDTSPKVFNINFRIKPKVKARKGAGTALEAPSPASNDRC
jgi:hypothetical protein